MASDPVGFRSLRHAFSLHRQTDVLTQVADGDITYQRGDIDFSPFGHENIAAVSDNQHFGKDPWPTYRTVLHRANMINSRERAASDLDLLFALGFVMGGHVAAQPDALLLPNTWTHTLTWVAHGTKPQMDYTSFLELVGSGSNPGYKEKLIGAWISQATISSDVPGGDHVKIAFEGGARERATSSATMPTAVSAASLMKGSITQLSFGNAGAEANVDGSWSAFELEFNSNPTRVLRTGQPTGEEELIERADRGQQSLTGSITFELGDTNFRQKFLAATEVGVVITLQSDDQVDSNPKTVSITIPHIQIAAADIGQVEESFSYTIELDETSVLRKSGDEPVTVVVTSDIDNTEFFTT